jgi:molybdopterin synthase catalytic subunit
MPKRLTKRRIDPNSILKDVQASASGGTVLFLGTVRDNSEAGKVDLIRYDAYEPMAEKKLRQIEEEVERDWPVKAKLVHRVGKLKVGEISVAVAVSSSHRAEAFEACRRAIELIKRDVPIWKKERLADGREVWVEGHAPNATTGPRMRQNKNRKRQA